MVELEYMKTELFLTSSAHIVAYDIAQKVDLSKANKLVFINTAAETEEEDRTWLENDRQALVDAGFIVSDYSITDKKRNQLETDLNGFDYIYLSGGDTPYLLQQSQKSGFISLIRELIQNKGKIYIGTSTGSIIAGPKIPDYLTDESEDIELGGLEGYGLVNFTIVPHWGSENFKERYLSKRLKIAYEKYSEPLILLRDNQYVHVRDDQIIIVDVNN